MRKVRPTPNNTATEDEAVAATGSTLHEGGETLPHASTSCEIVLNYLIVIDNGGGDFVWYIVDDERWAQIKHVYETQMTHKTFEFVCYLVDDNGDGEKPQYCPHRMGKLIKTFYTQTFALENIEIPPISGILTISEV